MIETRHYQCPSCDTVDSLEPVESEGRGVIVYVCTSCAKRCRINAYGEIVHVPDRRDVSGTMMHDDG